MWFFFNMIDVAGIAAYVLWTPKNTQWNETKPYGRRLFLQQLGRSLVDPHLNQCSRNPYAVQRNVRLAMQSLGFSIINPITTASGVSGKQRCHLCPRVRDKKLLCNVLSVIFLVVQIITGSFVNLVLNRLMDIRRNR
jgi:hypothetical protein